MKQLVTTLRATQNNLYIEPAQITIEQWMAELYGTGVPISETPAVAIPGLAHSDRFKRTYTRTVDVASDINIDTMFGTTITPRLDKFCSENQTTDMAQHYEKFFIPKHSGGMREINAPKPALKEFMRDIKKILEQNFHLQAHDTAYAYVKGRGCKDVLIEHQYNQSHWYLKLDLKDFFGSCNAVFITQQLMKVNPFGTLNERNKLTLIKLINLCLLDNGLPQGTPLSPMITNLIMLPIDYALSRLFNDRTKGNFVYTRYADDLLISSKFTFKYQVVVDTINAEFALQNAPFRINPNKTRYGSGSGSNWNLGLMLNKDNNITIGHRDAQRLKAGVNNFLKDFTSGNPWSIIDTQRLLGNLSYLRNINNDYCNFIIQRLEHKYTKNFTEVYKEILNS